MSAEKLAASCSRGSGSRAALVNDLGEYLYQRLFVADERAKRVARAKSAGAADARALQRSIAQAVGAEAVARFDGDKPEPLAVAKHGAEIVALQDYDSALRGAAVKMGDGWRPRVLYQKRRLSAAQYHAAARLADTYAAGGFGKIKGSSFQPRVDTSIGPQTVAPGHAARTAYLRAISLLPPVSRAIVVAVVIEGGTLAEALAADAVRDAPWMPAGRSNRLSVALAMLASGLDTLAESFSRGAT